ncbi:MAG: glycoside hydrolase family 78 protein [Dysgonamonadaceae bacterium]|jgi:alpha-L-rhamnosidase|nr:glycoside hydrolase family 78 protein [Dysgonamonadaceae bacterium]
MNSKTVIFYIILLSLLSSCRGAIETDAIQAVDLTCEYLVNPLSIDTIHPRFAWKIKQTEDAKPNQLQTAYQIIVASSPELLIINHGDLWNTGKVQSNASIQISYEGRQLETLQHCWWKVRVWNNHSELSSWSEPATFSMGILNANQWHGEWIGDRPDTKLREYRNYVETNYKREDFDRSRWENPPYLPSPLLRKSFEITDTVRRATLYASALGYYEMWINGERIGDQLQAPEWTNYNDCVQYQTYDLTHNLKHGENVLAATLADGWALGRTGGVKWNTCFPHRGFYAFDRRLIAQLVLELADGSYKIIPTDRTWKILTDGYIRMADNFRGETIDARKIPKGWTNTAFDDSRWEQAYEDREQVRRLVAQKNEPIRAHAELKPVKVWQWKNRLIADFGQNIAGHCRLVINGKAGQTVTLRHGEWLNDDGSIYTQSLGYATATDTFILSGGEDTFDPAFTYHGFQYTEISGVENTDFKLSAIAVSSDPEITGRFECSNPDINKLHENIVWTQRNNMYSIITDNPSRDERTGALGDILIFAQSAIYNMNMAGFFSKTVNDLHDTAPNGQFFSMIPSLHQAGFWEGWIGAPGWSEAGLVIPWRMYENYGDKRALESLYPEMKNHVDATLRENPDLIWRVRHNHNNDWLCANTISNPPDTTYSTKRGFIPDDLFATSFFAYASQLLSNISEVLDRKEDAANYATLADSIKAVFLREYVDADGHVKSGTQGAYALALHFDLIPVHLRERAFAHLLGSLEEYDFRLSTGIITTPMLMQKLVEYGRTDIAYRLLESDRFPSWLYQIRQGATTVWERWDAWIPGHGFQDSNMNSFDHVVFGAIDEWLYRHVLGINHDIRYPGYERFTLQPRPGGTLTWARGSYNTIRGEIQSSWRVEDGLFTLTVEIPANTTATVILPDGKKKKAGSGRHTFTAEIGK